MHTSEHGMPDSMHQPPHQDARATMTSDMQLFTQRIGDHSIAINAMQVGGVPWVRGNDVAVALGYVNPRKAIRDHVDQEDRQALDDLLENDSLLLLEHNEGSQVYINESGLYSLIMKSKMVYAKVFKRWVTNEVLPSIRQTGQYNAQQPRMDSGARAMEDGHATRSSPYELEMVRSARMQALTAAYTAAQAIGSSSQPRLQTEVQKAIDAMLLPQGDAPEQYVDAATILSERAYTGEQIARLAGELGKDLKMVSDNEGRSAQGNEQEFGTERHQVGLYHRVRDAGLIEDVLVSFKNRSLYSRVMAGEPDPVATRRQNLLSRQGRGRSRSQRGRM
jgi:prophage antirepressor-like protein